MGIIFFSSEILTTIIPKLFVPGW